MVESSPAWRREFQLQNLRSLFLSHATPLHLRCLLSERGRNVTRLKMKNEGNCRGKRAKSGYQEKNGKRSKFHATEGCSGLLTILVEKLQKEACYRL
ncbi:hypothetical protein CEXT_409511 [Caerostris extrusa]|uniref:Uncharacterized protein n=1 Tax=Caerostris extrusa TaxID=172846 RepID=A0AAV4S2H4_CAEEX|nr:hypothetical protein CEXT_409511 [Caerostris extrusa]